MNKYIKLVLLSTVLCFFTSSSLQAAEVKVFWTKPDNYRDIHPGEDSKKRFHKRLFNDLDKHFENLAADLPQGYTLFVNVTDLDLAGNIQRAGMKWGSQLKMVRKIDFKSIDAPQMLVYFKLFDQNNNLVHSGGNQLKRSVNKIKGNVRERTRDFAFEKKMIDDWFEVVFKEQLIK